MGLVTILTYIVLIFFLYVDVCFFHLPLHVLFLFYLYMHVSNSCMQSIIYVSHKDALMSFSRICVRIDFIVFNKWVIYDFSYMFICLLWFCHRLPKREIVRTYVIHLLGTYVTILCNWLILWQNALYLYLGRSRMCLILQETVFQDQMLKTCKSIQDSSWISAVH